MLTYVDRIAQHWGCKCGTHDCQLSVLMHKFIIDLNLREVGVSCICMRTSSVAHVRMLAATRPAVNDSEAGVMAIF